MYFHRFTDSQICVAKIKRHYKIIIYYNYNGI